MSEKKSNMFAKMKDFFVESKNEIKKIVWPTQRTVFKNNGVVLVMIFIMGVFVALCDAGLIKTLGLIMSVSTNK